MYICLEYCTRPTASGGIQDPGHSFFLIRTFRLVNIIHILTWGLRIISLSLARDKTKKHLPPYLNISEIAVFSSRHDSGTKKKFRVLMRNRPLDLRIPRSDALPLSHRDAGCGEQGPLRSLYITSVLYAARISNVDNVMSMVFF